MHCLWAAAGAAATTEEGVPEGSHPTAVLPDHRSGRFLHPATPSLRLRSAGTADRDEHPQGALLRTPRQLPQEDELNSHSMAPWGTSAPCMIIIAPLLSGEVYKELCMKYMPSFTLEIRYESFLTHSELCQCAAYAYMVTRFSLVKTWTYFGLGLF